MRPVLRANHDRYRIEVLDENGRLHVYPYVPENKVEMIVRAWPTVVSVRNFDGERRAKRCLVA